MEDNIEGLGELPFPLPSESEMTWLNEEIEEVNIGSQETPFTIQNLGTSSIAKKNSKMVSVAQTVGYEVSPW